MTRQELNIEECWRAVRDRDRSRDGEFVYGVLTTGVFCRPSCPSRRALRRNVRFFATTAEARREGLRPCLRCRPEEQGDGPNKERIAAVCRYVEAHAGNPLALHDLAAQAGLSPFHFQRVFRSAVGLTPRQYVEAVRLGNLKKTLRAARGVADAVYEAGYGSSSRVYERSDARLGMTPREYRRGGQGIGITYVAMDSPLGLLLLGATDRGLCFVQFGETKERLVAELRREYPAAELAESVEPGAELAGWMAALQGHLAGIQPELSLPLDVRATIFQTRVWRYLRSIPYGETRSYQEVAAGIGQPTAMRAVAQACAANPVALLIPCHRVIRRSGDLGGYRWGVERKHRLLAVESQQAALAPHASFSRAKPLPNGRGSD